MFITFLYPEYGTSILTSYYTKISGSYMKKRFLEENFELYIKNCLKSPILSREACEEKRFRNIIYYQGELEDSKKIFMINLQVVFASCLMYLLLNLILVKLTKEINSRY